MTTYHLYTFADSVSDSESFRELHMTGDPHLKVSFFFFDPHLKVSFLSLPVVHSLVCDWMAVPPRIALSDDDLKESSSPTQLVGRSLAV